MLDLSGFWSGWIISLTLIGLVWLAYLLYTVYFGKRWKDESHEVSQFVWDGNLREGNTPPPLWWFCLLVAMLVFSVIYIILYPGLGSSRGALAWTQAGQLQASSQADAEQYADLRHWWRTADLGELAADGSAMRVARRLYRRNCASCHGVDARGQVQRFPDLTDDAWQWGNSEAQLLETLHNGRTAAMPPWGDALGPAGVRQMVNYLLALPGGQADTAEHADARNAFTLFCAVCHSPDARGNPLFGAPNLRDDVWLYGGSPEEITHSITNGRQGQMPAQSRLTEEQLRLLAAWLQNGANGL